MPGDTAPNVDPAALAAAMAKALRGGAQAVGHFFAPSADSPGAMAVAGVRSLLPGGGPYQQEFDRYNSEAAPSWLYSPDERFGSVVGAPRDAESPVGGMPPASQARTEAMTMQAAMAGALRKPPRTEISGDAIKRYANLVKYGGKEFQEQQYPFELPVRVTFSDGATHVDSVKGLNQGHALARAASNWPYAVKIAVGDASEVAAAHQDDINRVARLTADRDLEKAGRRVNREVAERRKMREMWGEVTGEAPATPTERPPRATDPESLYERRITKEFEDRRKSRNTGREVFGDDW